MTAVVLRAAGGLGQHFRISSSECIASVLGASHKELRRIHLASWSSAAVGVLAKASLYAYLDERAMSGLPTPPQTLIPPMHDNIDGVFGDICFVLTTTVTDAAGLTDAYSGFVDASVVLCNEQRMQCALQALARALQHGELDYGFQIKAANLLKTSAVDRGLCELLFCALCAARSNS